MLCKFNLILVNNKMVRIWQILAAATAAGLCANQFCSLFILAGSPALELFWD